MSDAFADLLEAADGYVTHIDVVGPRGVGEDESELWVALEQARKVFLSEKEKAA